jgi:WD40 repeat protein/serine/threonine protein kinase/DNA-binding XRE family transcriptional regulator
LVCNQNHIEYYVSLPIIYGGIDMDREISFGGIVKEHRQILDLTQAELARRVACATITIRKIEYDSLRPSIQIAERLATSLKIPLEERAAFVRLARTASLKTPTPQPLPTPPPTPDEIGLEDLSGRAIRGYELGDLMGEGGFGVVYRAIQPHVEREVAVKIILPRYADHPEFIRRFEAEAQLVARLEHPHIVPLYDYWREPGAAFLVMRLMRGGSLHSRLKEGPLSLDFTLRLLNQVGGALYSAHRMGVIHRDLKPANILLDEDENTYLADFGVAKNLGSPDQTSDTMLAGIIGSPAYVSPEQIRAEPIRPQADIYALGILIFQLLTGRQPFQGPTPIDYAQQHLNQPTPPLLEYNPNLPPELEPVLERATAKAPEDRYPDIPSLVTEFQSAVTSAGVEMPPSLAIEWLPADVIDLEALENPYKGLRAFEEADSKHFFGRETLVQDLLGRMSEENDLSRFLAVVGPSGSGKSSAVKAGLIPSLYRGGLPGSEHWFIVEFTPGSHPFEELETALLRVAVNPPESLLGQLRFDERGLLRAVGRILPPDKTVDLVLVVDQFEELFTLVEDEDTRAAFLESILTAVLDPRSRLRVVITLRADFTDRPLEYVDFGELLRQRTEFVLPLAPDELQQAIIQPARGAGLALEPGLCERIIHDLGDQPGVLPLLQYALTELFERRSGRRLTLQAYQDSGGVLGALGKRAEEIYTDLDQTGQETARQVFLRLVTLGEGVEDTRRRVLQSELEALTPQSKSEDSPLPLVGEGWSLSRERSEREVRAILDSFGRARLLSFDRDPITRGPTVEVAHEALLREWSQLREWLDQSRADIRNQRVLGNSAADWLAADRDPSFLLRGARLDQFAAWAESTDLALTQHEQEYLEACLAERRAREAAEAERLAHEAALERRSRTFLRALVAVLGIAAVIAVILSLYAFNQQGIAQDSAATAQAEAFARGTQQVIAESEAQQRATQQAVAETEAKARSTAQADALEQKTIAEQQAQAAQRQAEWNHSLVLADESQDALQGNDRDLALALALAATQIEDPPYQAQIALSEAAYAPGTVRLYSGFEVSVYGAELSPDGRSILSNGADYFIHLWDLQTGKEIRQIEIEGEFNADFSPDGRQALVSLDDFSLVLIDLESGETIQRMTGHNAPVWGLAFSPDGQTALSDATENLLTEAAVPSMRLWDLGTGEEIRRFEGHSDFIADFAFAPDGRRALSGSWADGSLILWDLETGRMLNKWDYEPSRIVISPDGRTALFDNAYLPWDVILLDLETGEEIHRLEGHNTGIYSVAINPQGGVALSGDASGEIRVWDLVTGELLDRFNAHSSNVEALNFSLDGQTFISGSFDTTMRLWSMKNGAELRRFEHEDRIWDLAYSPDGSTAISVERGALHLWDLGTGDEIKRFELPADGWDVAYTPDGKSALVTLKDEGGVMLVDLATGEQIQRLGGEDQPVVHHEAYWVDAVAVSPDGKKALSGSQSDEGDSLFLWDLESGEAIMSFQTGSVHGLDISPDGRTALSGGHSFEESVDVMTLWDLESGEAIRQFEGHTSFISEVAYSPDGKTALSGSWDASLILWDLESGEIIHQMLGHTDAVRAAAISPDGRMAVSGSKDGTLILWDLSTGEAIRRYHGHNVRVNSVDFSPDGGTVLSGADDGVVIEWRIDDTLEELIDWTNANRYLYELTCSERARYGIEPLCE